MAVDLKDNFISALKEVGYKSGNVKWMIDNEATKDFFCWFSENIDSSNYLSEEDLSEYNEIQASGCILEGADLDKEIEKIIPDFDELDENETQVLQYLKNELARAENYSSDMKNSLEELRTENSSLDLQINQLESKNKVLENKFKKIQEIYYKNLTDFSGSIRMLGENIKDVLTYCKEFKEGVISSKLVSEFPILVYLREGEMVENDIQKRIGELKLPHGQQQNSNTHVGEWESELDDLKKRSEITRLLRLKHGAQRQAVQYSIAWLNKHRNDNSFWASVSSPSSIWKLTHDAMQRCLLMKQELGKLEEIGELSILETNSSSSDLWRKAKSGVQAFALCQKQKLESLQREITLLRKSRSLKAMSHIIQAEKALCSKDIILMMILGDEVYRVLNMSQIISSMTNAMEKMKIDGLQRMELMKSSKERRDYEIQRIQSYPLLHFLSSQLSQYSKTRRPGLMLSSTLSDHSSNESISSILENLSSSSENLKLELARIEDTFLQNANKHNLYIKSSYREVLKLKKRIYSGSTSKKPVICSLKGLSLLLSFDRKDNDLEIKIKKLKKISSSKKTDDAKTQKKLWVLFCMDQTRLKKMLQKEEYENYGVN